MTKATVFLMFQGRAEEAMNRYVSIFDGAKIEHIERYGADEPGREGTVRLARMKLAGLEIMCIDSPVVHDFTFTPAISLFVDCESAGEVDALFDKLSAGGAVMMPVGDYGFSARFGWVSDEFGVSWQLNLPA